jgi:multidrug resistance protein
MTGTSHDPATGEHPVIAPDADTSAATYAPPSAPPVRERSGSGKLVALMITAFIDMVGLLMVIPLLPFYAESLGENGLTLGSGSFAYHVGIGQIVALLVSAFTVAQLLSAPMWGRFSDRFGRRPALIIALTASAVAYVIFGFATSLWVLFLSRLVQGAGGGTVGVIQAYVADVARPEDRAKSLGWLSAATNAGVALGPVLGSWSTQGLGKSAPGLVAAVLCVVNIAFVWFFLRESRDAAHAHARKPRRSREAVLRVLTHSSEPASRLIWIYAVAIGAFQGVTSILALFLAQRFGVTEATIGYFFMYIGVISVLTRAAILGKLVDRYGEARLSRAGLVLMAVGLGALPFTTSYWQLAIAVAAMPLGTAFTFPCVTALLSRVIPNEERGLYMGVQQTFGGASRAIYPMLAGFLFDHLGAGFPFWLSAVLVLLTLPLGLDMESYTKGRT